MSGRTIHRVTAALLGVAMLAAPTFAARQTACGGDCFQSAKSEPADVSNAASGCCGGTKDESRSTCSESDRASTCLACCAGDRAAPPMAPSSREQSADLAVSSPYLVSVFAVPSGSFRHSFVAPITAPFWFADDGPSRQAFLGRFTF